jgi:hypothetical protein
MYHDGGTTVVKKRMSFLSVLVLSATAIIVTVILSASGIAVYGLGILDAKTDSLTGLISEAVRGLPEIRKALPPALADAINDERRPEYRDQLDVSVRLVGADRDGYLRTVVEVTNRGDELVSLLGMRIVGLDGDGDPLFERNTLAATPLQIDDDWRGPLLPHETRRFSIWHYHLRNGTPVEVAYEITDVRVWRGNAEVESVESVETVTADVQNLGRSDL